MAIQSIRLPLKETAKVTSVKLPLKETVWIINGFIISERIIEWKKIETILIETIKSRILVDVELIDKNHIKLTWYGDAVPKIQIYKKRTEEEWGTTPIAELKWSLGTYIAEIDTNSYDFKIIGIEDTGEADTVSIGSHQEYDIDVKFELPINEKKMYFDIEIKTEYRFEVNI